MDCGLVPVYPTSRTVACRRALAAEAIVRSGGAIAVQLDTTQVRIEKKKIMALILALGYEIWKPPQRCAPHNHS